MSTIKISKNQWEFIGKKAGWLKKAQRALTEDESDDDVISRSMKDTLVLGYNLAGDIVDIENEMVKKGIGISGAKYLNEDKMASNIAAWCDGLVGKYVYDMVSGRTSLKKMLDFDMDKFQRKCEKDIIIMQKILAQMSGQQ